MKIYSLAARYAALFTLIMLYACGEDPMSMKGPGEELTVETLGKKKGPKVEADVVLLPSGDATGVTDANAIEAAMATLPSGGTILLESGTFYINRMIVVPGFDGNILGSGKDETEIIGVGDNGGPFGGFAFFLLIEPSGSLSISHLSMSLPDGFETFGGNLGVFIFTILNSEGTDTRFEHLRLTGTEAIGGDPVLISQPFDAIRVDGDDSNFPAFSSGGDHVIANCNISKIAFEGHIIQALDGASITVANNSYSEIKQTLIRYLSDSEIAVTNNEIDAVSLGAIVITQESWSVPGESNSVLIRNNNVFTAGFMPIEIGFIPDGGAGFDLLIEKNKLINDGVDPLGWFPNLTGIGIFNGNNGAVIRNNNINGEADFGILVETNGSMIQGNNTNGLDALAAHYGLFGDDNTVIGTGNSTVIDLGVGNIITGLKKVDGESIGDRMKAAQAKRKEILDSVGDYKP